MAKFELPIYNAITGELEKTHKRNFMPVSLYIRFQEYAEKVEKNQDKMSEKQFFVDLKKLYLEMFPELTSEEYDNQTDVAKNMILFQYVLDVAKQIQGGDSKNV